MTMRFALKAATDDIHRELDDRLSRLDLGRVEDYRRFLEFQARTVPAVEGALACAGLGDFVEGWTNPTGARPSGTTWRHSEIQCRRPLSLR